jgi:hypothetical protein
MRGHTPVTIEEFKGLFDKGNKDDIPLDHFQICQNMSFGQGRMFSRPKWSLFSNAINQRVRRTFTYNAQSTTFLIYMTYDGYLYTQKVHPTIEAPVFRQAWDDTTDFDMVSFNNRAYIAVSRFGGFLGHAMYIFDGTLWKTAGFPTPGASSSGNYVNAGNIEAGVHYFGFAVETKTGFISKATAISQPLTPAPGNRSFSFVGIPDYSGDATVARVRIVATKVVQDTVFPANGLELFSSFFVPGGILNPGVLSGEVNFYDSQLLQEASYLQDIMPAPPGGSFIGVYHNRLVVGAAKNEGDPAVLPGETRHRLMFSRVNDPETFEVVDGTLLIDPSSDTTLVSEVGGTDVILTGITDGHVYRDILYVGKLNSMHSVSDNGDIPANWPIAKIDDGNGSFQHGFMTVLDSGGVNVEYMLIANRNGIFVFNGLFNFPEMTYKISNIWLKISKNPYKLNAGGNTYPARAKNHYIIDPFNKKIGACVCEDGANEPTAIYYCDFSETSVNDSEYFMNVKWSVWDMFNINITAMCAFDNGVGTKFLGFNSIDQQLYELDGPSPVQEIITTNFSRLRTAFIKDPSNTFLHCNGHSLTLVGDPTAIRLINFRYFDRTNTLVLNSSSSLSVPMGIAQGEITLISNVTRQSFCLDMNSEYIDVRRINIYVKPSFKTMPQ